MRALQHGCPSACVPVYTHVHLHSCPHACPLVCMSTCMPACEQDLLLVPASQGGGLGPGAQDMEGAAVQQVSRPFSLLLSAAGEPARLRGAHCWLQAAQRAREGVSSPALPPKASGRIPGLCDPCRAGQEQQHDRGACRPLAAVDDLLAALLGDIGLLCWVTQGACCLSPYKNIYQKWGMQYRLGLCQVASQKWRMQYRLGLCQVAIHSKLLRSVGHGPPAVTPHSMHSSLLRLLLLHAFPPQALAAKARTALATAGAGLLVPRCRRSGGAAPPRPLHTRGSAPATASAALAQTAPSPSCTASASPPYHHSRQVMLRRGAGWLKA